MSDFVARLAVKGMMTCAGCRDAENKQPHTCGIDFALHEQERTSVGAAALATDKRKRHEVQLRSDTCGVAVKFDTADGAAPPPPPGAPALPKVWLRTPAGAYVQVAGSLARCCDGLGLELGAVLGVLDGRAAEHRGWRAGLGDADEACAAEAAGAAAARSDRVFLVRKHDGSTRSRLHFRAARLPVRGASGRVLQAVVRRKLGLAAAAGPALRARIVSAAGEEQADGDGAVLASHADWERLARHPPPAPPRLVVEAT